MHLNTGTLDLSLTIILFVEIFYTIGKCKSYAHGLKDLGPGPELDNNCVCSNIVYNSCEVNVNDMHMNTGTRD